MEYNILNGPIRWRISAFMKVIGELSSFSIYHHFKFCDLDNVGQGYDVQHWKRGPFDSKYMTSYLMSIIMFALSLTIYEILANQINCKKKVLL